MVNKAVETDVKNTPRKPRTKITQDTQTAPDTQKTTSAQKTISFEAFNLCEPLQHSLERLGFTAPTAVQQKAIPFAMAGRDIIVSAETGGGKTAAFALPILEKLMSSCHGMALILAPTRELAAQVLKVFHDLLPKKSPIKTALLIGGAPIGKQLADLRGRPRVVVATPGRANDLLNRRALNLKDLIYLVLDEADRMLDMGFGPQIDDIVESVPEERQTFLFSATLSKNIIKLSQKYLNNPERVAIGESHKVTLNIKQEVIHAKSATKYTSLLKELEKREGSIIVFVKTKRGAEELADRLCENDHRADAIHGDLQQRRRDKVILAFRNKAYRIMVATDVAARGLDIPHIEHVINYDLPQSPEDYVHRIGRTARAGKKGSALSFVSSRADEKSWNDIYRFMDNGQGEGQQRPQSPRQQQRPGYRQGQSQSQGQRQGFRQDFRHGQNRNSSNNNNNNRSQQSRGRGGSSRREDRDDRR